MAAGNAWSSDNPAKETKGGTGQAAYTQGDILYSDATNSLAKLAVGTNGQILTSNGTVPGWAAASSSGSLINLSTQAASASSSIEFTSVLDDTYRAYFFCVTGCVPATDADTLVMEYSTNNGSSWETTSYSHYCETFNMVDGTTNSTNGGGIAYIRIHPTGTCSNVAAEALNFEGYLFSPTTPNSYTRATWQGNYDRASDGDGLDLRGSGTRGNLDDVTAIRFRFLGGNIASGSFALYGLANS